MFPVLFRLTLFGMCVSHALVRGPNIDKPPREEDQEAIKIQTAFNAVQSDRWVTEAQSEESATTQASSNVTNGSATEWPVKPNATADTDPSKNPTCGLRFHDQHFATPVARGGIVGGTDAVFGAYPWQVSIKQYFGTEGKFDLLCGGTIIDDRHILTAAHCIMKIQMRLNPQMFLITAGERSLTAKGWTEENYTIEDFGSHPYYREETMDHDFAVIRVDRKIKFGPYVQPACIPSQAEEFLYKTGRKMIISGWGSMQQDVGDGRLPINPDVLQAAQVDIVDKQFCKMDYKNMDDMDLTENMFCAGVSGRIDACQGDSGGPAVTEYQGRFYVIGIVSFGLGCAAPGIPGVYTKVNNYSRLLSKIQNLG